MEEITREYLKAFGELPPMPQTVSMLIIVDMMEDAILAKTPLTQQDIWERIEEIGEPVDTIPPR